MSRSFLNLFIAFHLFALGAWTLPETNLLHKSINARLQGYLRFMGLWQQYSMFAPDPLDQNIHLRADVERADGTFEHWDFPSLRSFGLDQRYRMGRWSQISDSLRKDENSQLWEGSAGYVARLFEDPKNAVQSVGLRRLTSPIPPPQPADYQDPRRPLPSPRETLLYTLQLGPEEPL